MAGPDTDTEFGRWQAAENLPEVEYSRLMLDEIRAAATDAFHRVPHGGMEIGGVLYGFPLDSGVRIVAWKPIPIEHARGPSFLLSERDEALLPPLLRPSGEMRAAGWYVSHGRGELSLSEEDLRISENHFPKPWQVVLVLKPAKFLPVRAAFFAREPGRAWSEATQGDEFTLEPMRRNRREGNQAARREPEKPHRGAHDSAEPEPPKFLTRPVPASRLRKRWVAVALLVTALAYAGWRVTPKVRLLAAQFDEPPHLALRLTDYSGQLHIEWNRQSPAIEHAESGLLDIAEGNQTGTVLDLDGNQLRKSSVTYARRGEDVRVRLTVFHGGRQSLEVAQFIGPPVPKKTAELEALQGQNRDLEQQVRKLRGQLKDERRKTRDLETGIGALEKQQR